MSWSLTSGRTLDPDAVVKAKHNREQRLSYLDSKIKEGTMLSLTKRERHEWRRLTGLMHP